MSDVKRLVYSFIQFLGDQLSNTSLSADAIESLEVAIQCLESAYGIQHAVPDSNLQVSRPLLSIFSEATKHENVGGAVPAASEPMPKPVVSEEEKREAARLKDEGNQLMKSEKYPEALDHYTQAIRIDANNAIYYCNRAAAYSKMNEHRLAIEDCRAAIQLEPGYGKAYGRMGLAYDSLNQHRLAKECYEKAVDLDPQNDGYRNNLKVAEDKLKETNLGPQGVGGSPGLGTGFGGGGGSGNGEPFDLGSLLHNPTLMNMVSRSHPNLMNMLNGPNPNLMNMFTGPDPTFRNMATQMMADPNIQQVMGNLLSGSAAPQGAAPGFDALLQAGQQLAAQMQATNPNLVDMLRQQMQNNPQGPPDQDGNPGNPPNN